MGGMIGTARGGLLAASVLAGLGFGAKAALATPADEVKAAICIQQVCNARCEALYGPFAAGYCEDGVCKCAV